MSPGSHYDYAIVGAGFSGIAIAVQLLQRLAGSAHICIINRSHRFGRGLAYGTNSSSHVLNVPAGRMGIDPSNESGFIDYLTARGLPFKSSDFVPRNLYGEYLEEALRQATHTAWPMKRLDMISMEVQALEEGALPADPMRLRLSTGEAIEADSVVLALGNFAPTLPRIATACDWTQRGLIGDPWAARKLALVPPDADVLLIGSGLTAYDVVLQLLDRGHRGNLVMLSRRGLMPQSHRQQESPPTAGLIPPDVLSGEASARACLKAVREFVREAEATGHDWRDVIGGLRAATPRLWQQLSASSRRQFLRHLSPYWDTHRHRTAPVIYARVAHTVSRGQLTHMAGRLTEVETTADGRIEVHWRARSSDALQARQFGAVVNCTGPSSDLSRVDDPLIRQLLGKGKLKVDPLSLGLCVDANYSVVSAAGQPVRGLHYVGPLLKAQHWEATAVPELRQHAAKLAGVLAAARASSVA